jgi:hypothetical protein
MLSAFDAIEVLENASKLTVLSTMLNHSGAKISGLTEAAKKELRPDLF